MVPRQDSNPRRGGDENGVSLRSQLGGLKCTPKTILERFEYVRMPMMLAFSPNNYDFLVILKIKE